MATGAGARTGLAQGLNRDRSLEQVRAHGSARWDVIVIGGGATGAGIAVDACTRGYKTLLLEREDFGKATSSRSTKLVHGGVRYLARGNVSLVMEALAERGRLRANAPHLVHDLEFVVPNYSWADQAFYGVGLKTYDLLAARHSFGRSLWLNASETQQALPNVRREDLRGGVLYHDGQFDDARLLVHLMMTAADHGATLLNYAPVVGLLREGGQVSGVVFTDRESGDTHEARARVVISAAGIFADEVRQMADSAAAAMVSPSQGIHLVFRGDFLRSKTAMLVPRTRDGRVMFAIPWHGHTLVGTTDTPVAAASYEPLPLEEEIRFLLETSAQYMQRTPSRTDALAMFAGIRPLVKSGAARTASLSRDHTLDRDSSGLWTIVGGKWTTYRRMAQDAVDRAASFGGLPHVACRTETLRIHGWKPTPDPDVPLAVYGADADGVRALIDEEPSLGAKLHPELDSIRAEVVWAARHEMARTLDDVLSRRTRALQLNAWAAMDAAPEAARLLARELGHDDAWQRRQFAEFNALAKHYLP